jgi:hypothetical protein
MTVTTAPIVLPSDMPRLPVWRWVVGPWDSGPERELVYASNRQLQFTNNAPTTATFNLPGETDEAGLITEGYTDVWVWADSSLCFRGRVTGTTDTLSDTGTYTLAVSCTDYRGVLTRRMLVEGDAGNVASATQVAYSSSTYAGIAWDLVYKTQAKPGGALGIVQGDWVSDPVQAPANYRVRNYDYGEMVGKAIDDLGGDATFDYRIRPRTDPMALYMDLYYPARAAPNDLVLELGGTVSGLTRAFAMTDWANVTRTSGAPDSTTGVVVYSPDPSGRWEQQVGYPDVTLQSTVQARSASDHSTWFGRRSTMNLTMRPGVVTSPAVLDVGDTCLVVVRHGRLSINETRTVSTINYTVDDNGVSSTTVGVIEAT